MKQDMKQGGLQHLGICLLIFAGFLFVPPSPSFGSEAALGSAHAATDRVLVFTTFPSEGMGILFGKILNKAYAHLGYDIVLERVPAERALVMSNAGMVDGEAGRVAVVEKRNPNLVRVPTPLYVNRIVAFGKHVNVNLSEGWEGLRGLRVGAVIGYKFLEKMTKKMNTEYVSSYRNLFSMLDNGRIDVAVSEKLEALPTIKKMALNGVHEIQPVLALNPMYHYLHRDHANLVPAVDAVLRQMAEEGEMERILREIEAEYAVR